MPAGASCWSSLLLYGSLGCSIIDDVRIFQKLKLRPFWVYLENLNGDCPADGDAWGWVRVTRHDRDGDAYHELQRPPHGTLLGHAGEDWLYLFPEQAYQFVTKAARDANSVFPVESTTLLKHLADGGMIATATESGQVRRTVKQR